MDINIVWLWTLKLPSGQALWDYVHILNFALKIYPSLLDFITEQFNVEYPLL